MPTQDEKTLSVIAANTIAHYDSRAEAFWEGTRDHDVTQNRTLETRVQWNALRSWMRRLKTAGTKDDHARERHVMHTVADAARAERASVLIVHNSPLLSAAARGCGGDPDLHGDPPFDPPKRLIAMVNGSRSRPRASCEKDHCRESLASRGLGALVAKRRVSES